MWTDRNWFLEHPGTQEYYRPLEPFDICCKSFDGIMFEDEKVPKMKVTRLGDYCRTRHYPFEKMAVCIAGPWMDEPESRAALRFFSARGIIGKPGTFSFPTAPADAPVGAPPECESPPEQMFWDSINDVGCIELAYAVPQFKLETEAGRYRLDFAIPDRRLAIEVDGLAFHNGQDSFIRDRNRQRDLEMSGWRVLRFAAKEVMNDAKACVRQAASWAASA
jgi:very-short-patch-repair endonuclease